MLNDADEPAAGQTWEWRSNGEWFLLVKLNDRDRRNKGDFWEALSFDHGDASEVFLERKHADHAWKWRRVA